MLSGPPSNLNHGHDTRANRTRHTTSSSTQPHANDANQRTTPDHPQHGGRYRNGRRHGRHSLLLDRPLIGGGGRGSLGGGEYRLYRVQDSLEDRASRLPLFLQYPDSIDIGFRREARFGVRAPYRYRYRRSVAACIVLTLFYIVGIRIQIHLIGHSSRGSNGGCQIKCFEPKRVCEPLPPVVIPSPLLPALNALPPPPS